ncbi:MAG: hypothetical protein HC904_00765 [Blastochloris sp.]|nr:hypothetical protein [Blastochloris sp.]
MKIFVVGAPLDWEKDTPLKVMEVIEVKDLSCPAQENKTFELGKVTFTSTQTSTGSTRWRAGTEYEGFVVEVTQGDQLLFEDSKGGNDVKKAVEAHKKNKDKPKSKS